uniref:hypothetical protein n=1 Tax=Rheinheimera sp. TaxID=1869214 RepID=UPI004047FEB5
MRLAVASKEDLKIAWRICRNIQRIEQWPTELMERRAKAAIVGHIERLGSGGFVRIVMGYETLFNNCADPECDHLDFNAKIKAGFELLEAKEKEAEVPA